MEFLEKELLVAEGLKFPEKHNILNKQKIKRLNREFEKIEKWEVKPLLEHCDLRLKNALVNDEGHIKAIIDWENCVSNCAPYGDFSIALHDLSIDGKQKFLEGYEPDIDDFYKEAYALTAFNIINYIPALQSLINRKDRKTLNLFKLRLDGSLDLFSR